MVIRSRIVILYMLCLIAGCSSQKEISFSEMWDTTRVLNNPHKGWYHHLLDNGINKYEIRDDTLFEQFPGMDHLYLRLAWSYLEPEEGKYDWSYIDDVVKKYVPKGYGVSFRITSKETGTYPGAVGQEVNGVQFATPYWVVKAGAKGVAAGSRDVKSWTPVWDDPVYLEKLDNFHRAFAARYDGQPWVRYADVGSIGEWGEGHTYFSTKVPPTVEEVKANIDIYLKNYKKTLLVVTDDLLYYRKSEADVKTLYEYATGNGMTLRDDSPMVKGYVENYLSTWTISHPQFYDPLYLTKPIVFELEHYRSVKANGFWLGKNGEDTIPALGFSGADILRGAIRMMHPTYIGYHGYLEDWLKDNPDLTAELANICGYWYFPVKAVIPPRIYPDKENLITVEWLNKGLAPAYNKFGLLFKFESSNHESTFNCFIEDSGNRKWSDGGQYMENYHIQIPPGSRPGRYNVKFKLVERTTDGIRDIQLGLRPDCMDSQGFVTAGKIKLSQK